MSSRVVRFGVVVGCMAVLAAGGCIQSQSRVPAPGIDASAAGEQAIEMFDADKDGFIAGAELDKVPGVKAALVNIDTNKDGKASAEEITARIKSWQESRVGLMSIPVTVTQLGRPLAGAKVRFVPEKFLGDKLQVAEGETDAEGLASLSVPPDPDRPNLRGVPCGLYRVEITKDGANIPAIYNTETTFGQEIANDAAGIRNMQFNM